jgi:hypothetical protein
LGLFGEKRRHEGALVSDGVVEDRRDEAAVPGVLDIVASAGEGVVTGGGCTACDSGKIWRLLERHKLRGAAVVNAETEEAGRVTVAETAEEDLVGGVQEPPLGYEGGADEIVGEAEAEEDLVEQVVVAKNSCHQRGRRSPSVAFHILGD